MAVTTTKTNKPLNPRGNDQSPKGYNRAELYTGKALDFDGTNDILTMPTALTSSLSTTTITHVVNFKTDFNSFASTRDDVFTYAERGVIFSFNNGTIYIYYRHNLSSWGNFKIPVDKVKLQEWNHCVIVIDYDNDFGAAYINGQEVVNQSGLTGASIDYNSNALTIGAQAGGRFFNGQLSGFKIFNTALTAAQVADLYNNPEKIVPTGVSNDALKLWLPMQEGAGTTAYDGSADLTDYVTNGDFSDGTNDWTASNATLSVEGGALKITSTGGNRPQGYQIITGLTIGRKYLLSAVARVGTTPYNMEIEIAGIGASGSYNKTNNSTDTYIYYEFTAGSTSHQIQAKIDNDPVPIGETGYFDNIKLLDLGNYGTINGATWVQGVGAPVSQTAVIDWNKWYLDHTNEVLIPQGLTTGRDLLGNLFENVRKQGALNLDGNSWAEVHDNASLDITDAITLEAWVYWDNTQTAKGILGKWNSSSTQCYLIYVASSSRAQFYTSTTGSNAQSVEYTIPSDGWVHIVGTDDGTNQKLYINGEEEATRASLGSIFANDKVLEIGRYNEATIRQYPNDIAQPRIYNRALTAEEVQRNFDAGKYTYTND